MKCWKSGPIRIRAIWLDPNQFGQGVWPFIGLLRNKIKKTTETEEVD